MSKKWKRRAAVIAWVLLLTYGLSGLFIGLSKASYFINKDYFQTDPFNHTLDDFINKLWVFELSKITKEDAKKEITVTKDEIDEHRYRYGNLNEQITSIKEQYEGKIQDALEAKNEEVANIYKAERDAKIEDITKNFTSDDHVRQKIIKEKEAEIDQYFEEMEQYRREFLDLKNTFQYYLRNVETGEIFTNIEGSPEQVFTSKQMAFIKTYKELSTADRYQHFGEFNEAVERFYNKNAAVFTGQIAVPKAAPESNTVLQEYYDFKQDQIIYYIYTLVGIAALVLSIYLYKKTEVVRVFQPELDQIAVSYNRVPIDVKFAVFFITVCIAIAVLDDSWFLFGYPENIYSFAEGVIYHFFWTTLSVACVLLQAKLLVERYKVHGQFKEDLSKAMVWRIIDAVKSAFLNRRVGTQVIIILAIVFAFGMGFAAGFVEPIFFVFYFFAFLFVGFPLFIWLMKRIGYFNRIVKHTSELAAGNFEQDLPVKGKSVLANFARNINELKYGVKASQRERAKSERLKTELITNVSHDLRTPLTSIITYTELLKTPDLSEDERNSYIEIIDRKSKRLKVLIDDLFEASKMASGNIELLKEKVDVAQLLQQALAEYDEKINESTLQFRVTGLETPVYAVVDGQKMWRVFDNLIGNILKYSLEHTRVYIDLKRKDNKVIIEFKNIAKYELGCDVDELFERFKRGDASRQTEGSGLGLAIAKSIVDLHGGELTIVVDGDLFKVTVVLDAS